MKERTVGRLYDISCLVGIGACGYPSVCRLGDDEPLYLRAERIDLCGFEVDE